MMTYENRTLYSTWQVSYEQIRQRNKVSAKLLRLWAYFDNQDLWYELLHHLRDEDHEWMRELTKDNLTFEDCMRVLCNHGLAEANAGSGYEVESKGYGVHACVHAWIRAVLNADQDHSLGRMALVCVASHVPDRHKPQWSLIQRRLLAHARRCIEGISEEMCNSPDLLWVPWTFGNLYYDQGRIEEAEEMYMRALRGYEEAWGAKHTSTLDTVNNLGALYQSQGRMKEAEEMYMRALRGKEEAWGAKHTSTLQTINNLGALYRSQGRMKEAEEMYMRALRGKEEAWGAKHTSTLDTVNNLGILYQSQGRIKEAEEMYMRALRGKEEAWGAKHTSTLQTINNLGILYSDQGRMKEAEEMYMRALRGKEEAWGAKHTSTLDTVNNLGLLYWKQGKMKEAEEMYVRALRGKEEAWGAKHTSTLDNLGLLYWNRQQSGKLVL